MPVYACNLFLFLLSLLSFCSIISSSFSHSSLFLSPFCILLRPPLPFLPPSRTSPFLLPYLPPPSLLPSLPPSFPPSPPSLPPPLPPPLSLLLSPSPLSPSSSPPPPLPPPPRATHNQLSDEVECLRLLTSSTIVDPSQLQVREMAHRLPAHAESAVL